MIQGSQSIGSSSFQCSSSSMTDDDRVTQPPSPRKIHSLWESFSALISPVVSFAVSIGILPVTLYTSAKKIIFAVFPFFRHQTEKKLVEIEMDDFRGDGKGLSLLYPEPDLIVRPDRKSDERSDTILLSFFDDFAFGILNPDQLREFLEKQKPPSLQSLVELNASDKQLESVPPEVQYVSLRSLDISGNRFLSFPLELIPLSSKLEELNLSSNCLTELSHWISVFSKLNTLNISFNPITEIPFQIGHLSNLAYFHFENRGNQLKALPKEIGALIKLKMLNLSGNSLQELPDVFSGFKKLKHLSVDGNKLVGLPDSICDCSELEEIYCSNNKLKQLPRCFGSLKKLRFLNVFMNEIDSLPDSLGACSSLTYLQLANNKLASLPASINRLKKLTTLSLASNKFSELPDFLADLKNVAVVDVSKNPLHDFPKVFTKMKNLEKLYLDPEQMKRWQTDLSKFMEEHPQLSVHALFS